MIKKARFRLGGEIAFLILMATLFCYSLVSAADTPTPTPTFTPSPTPIPPLIANINAPNWQRTPSIPVGWSVSGAGNPYGIKTVKITRTNPDYTTAVILNNSYPQSTANISGSINDNLPSVSALYWYDLEASDYLGRSDSDSCTGGVDSNPPLVGILSPGNNYLSSRKLIEVIIQASDIGSGLDYVYLYRNTSLVDTKSFTYYPTTPQQYSASIELTPGPNTLYAQALDLAGWSSSSTSINVTYEPPKFIYMDVSPLQIGTLGELINLSYKINYDGQIRISVSDASGNEFGVVTSPEWISRLKNPEPTATPHATSFNGSVSISNQFQLLENGNYYLKVEYRSNDGEYYEDQVSGNKYYLSPQVMINIDRTSVTASALTSPNPSNYRIAVPEVDFSFISQVTNAVGVVIPRNPSGKYSVPTQGTYQASAGKDGYKPVVSAVLFDPTIVQEFTVVDFNPYMPNESGYVEIHSDADQMPDGWEYQYWITWQGWIPACGCDLSVSDGAYDPDMDGLQNLEEYRLQGRGFSGLSPRARDLCVELDWVRSPERNYAPDSQNYAGGTCETIFNEAGVKVHWAVPGPSNEIFIGDGSDALPEVTLERLRQLLRDSQCDYGEANTDGDIDVVHAIFAPGWTVIQGITQSGTASTGGLYLKNPGGVFVFDLHTRNVVAGRVEQDTTASPLLGRYEGNILAHEIGHVLGLQDRGE